MGFEEAERRYQAAGPILKSAGNVRIWVWAQVLVRACIRTHFHLSDFSKTGLSAMDPLGVAKKIVPRLFDISK